MQPQPIIHIGYHKTGSTFLQKKIFEKFPDQFKRVNQREIFNQFIYPKALTFSEEKAKTFVNEMLAEAGASGRITVFSNERLSGGPHNGGYDSKEIALRLKATIPNPKIIIVIREQADMIYSLYGQYVKAVGSCSLKEYLNPSTKKNSALWDYSFLEYHRLIMLYQELFGKENVLVLPFEMLKEDYNGFVSSVLNFSNVTDVSGILQNINGAKVNEAFPPILIGVKRFFNPFIMKGHPYVGNTLYNVPSVFLYKAISKGLRAVKLQGINTRLKNKRRHYIAKAIQARYGASNGITSSMIGIDLQKYGYQF